MTPPPPRPADAVAGWIFLALWWLVGLLCLPLLALHPRLRSHVWRVPHPEPGWTWVHGASAGEHRVTEALSPSIPLLWATSSSPRTPVPGAFPAPADLPMVIGPWLNRARPGRLVLIESELWPGWLVACRQRGIPVAVVQARPSRGWRRWAHTGPVWRWLMQGVEVIEQAAVGDLKAAAPTPIPARPFAPGTVVLASSRPGDEETVVQAWQQLVPPRPPLAIAPRHLSRLPEVEATLRRHGVAFQRQSARDTPADILLIDTFGELGGRIPTAAAVVMGGTWDPALGGHSPAEAVAGGVPVVAGPHRHANPAAWAAATVVDAGTTAESLARALTRALQTPKRPRPASDAVARTLARLPPPVTSPPRSHRPMLWPLVPLVHGIGRLRPAWWATPTRVGVPVVSVGGITAGGTGKTPLAGWLAEQLDGAWVVARGHRRPRNGPATRVGLPDHPPEAPLGDELEMLRQRGIPVVSAPDRVAGAQEAIRRGARCIILDDGFQHRRLHRDLDLVCVDSRWPDGGGPIPVGTAREPWSALARADALVVFGEGCPTNLPALPVWRARLLLDHVRLNGVRHPLSSLPRDLHIGCGIARPSGLLCALLRRGHRIVSARLAADHAPLAHLPHGSVITEKDAARGPLDPQQRVLCATVQLADGGALHAMLLHAGFPLRAASSSHSADRSLPCSD